MSVIRMCLAKPHTLFSATFIDRKLVFSCSNGRHDWLLNKGKSNCQSPPLGTASLPTTCAQWKSPPLGTTSLPTTCARWKSPSLGTASLPTTCTQWKSPPLGTASLPTTCTQWKSPPLGTASLPTTCAQWKWTKQRLMVVYMLVLATYVVSRSSLSDT